MSLGKHADTRLPGVTPYARKARAHWLAPRVELGACCRARSRRNRDPIRSCSSSTSNTRLTLA